ncbi:hypothetical protein R6Q57_013180 [Mikania cordata]
MFSMPSKFSLRKEDDDYNIFEIYDVGIKPLSNDNDVMNLFNKLSDFKIIDVYVEHGDTSVLNTKAPLVNEDMINNFEPFLDDNVEYDSNKEEALNDDVDSESDFVANEIHDVEADMRDYKFHIDTDEPEVDVQIIKDIDDEVLDNESFDSGWMISSLVLVFPWLYNTDLELQSHADRVFQSEDQYLSFLPCNLILQVDLLLPTLRRVPPREPEVPWRIVKKTGDF